MINFIKKHLRFLMVILLVLMTITGCASPTLDNPILSTVSDSIEVDTSDISSLLESLGHHEDKPINKVENPIETDVVIDSQLEGQLEVHFIDVGQGDTILIKQGSHSMMVDAGDNQYGDKVVNYIKQEGIKELSYVIGTHPHADHIGGLDDVINSFDVKTVIMPKKTHTTKTFEDVLKAISSKGLKVTTPIVGQQYELGQAKFTILHPTTDDYSNLNDYSVSIMLEFGSNSFILTGDAEKTAENEMINNGLNLEADVMKAGHHGSNTSNTDKFLDRVNPSYVVIQVGEANKYNHPDKDILDKFTQRGIQIYRNDLHGSVVVTSDGANIEFKTENGETP